MSPYSSSLEHLKSLSSSYQSSRKLGKRNDLDVPTYSSHLSSRTFSIDEGSTIASLQNKYNRARLHSAGDSTISSLKSKYEGKSSGDLSMSSQIVPRRRIKKSGSLEESSNITTLKTITKLQAEIQKLKAISAFNKAEYEETILAIRNEREAIVDNTQTKIEETMNENEVVKEEIKRLQDFGERTEATQNEKEQELRKIQEENDCLEKDIEESEEVERSYEDKHKHLESKMKEAIPMLNKLKQQQEGVLSASKQLITLYEKQCSERKKLFQRVMSEEKEMNGQIIEGTGKELNIGLERNCMAMKGTMNRLK